MRSVNPPAKAAAQVAELARLRRRLPPPAMRRALRVQAGLTLVQVAAAVGDVTAQAVGHWEAGTRSPSDAVLATYVAVLDELAVGSRAPA